MISVHNGLNVNAPRDSEGATLLTLCVCEKQIQLLLHYGADPDGRSYNKATPLHIHNNIAVVNMLIDAGADITLTEFQGHTPMFMASAEKTELLLLLGADVNETDRTGRTPIFYSDMEATKVLITHGADLNVVADHGESLLFHEQTGMSGERLTMLKEAGATIMCGV